MLTSVKKCIIFAIREYSEYSIRILDQIVTQYFTGYFDSFHYILISVTARELF